MRFYQILIFLLTILSFSISVCADEFTLQSVDFADKSIIPVLHTCDGTDIPPQFSWENPPPKTKSFALVLSEPKEKKYYWIYYNIPSKSKEYDPKTQIKLAGSITGLKSLNNNVYVGPCPPPGTVRTYTFSLHALDRTLNVTAKDNLNDVIKSIDAHTIQKVQMTAVYSRWPTASVKRE